MYYAVRSRPLRYDGAESFENIFSLEIEFVYDLAPEPT